MQNKEYLNQRDVICRPLGLEIRLNRLKTKEGFYFILAIDHGLTSGAIAGITDILCITSKAKDNNIPSIVVNNGLLLRNFCRSNCPAIILQLMGLPLTKQVCEKKIGKVIVATVYDAIRFGADSISVQLNLNSTNIDKNLEDVSSLICQAHEFNYPVLLMMNELIDHVDPVKSLTDTIRIGTEIGADIIKVPFPTDTTKLLTSPDLKATIKLGSPVVLAGGPQSKKFHEKLQLAADLGFQGVCIGRNIFQSQDTNNSMEEIRKIFSKISMV